MFILKKPDPPARKKPMSSPRSTVPALTVGRREHRKHLTRRELMAAGRRLFGEQGLYESRIEDLARNAGIAKGTLYGYFANKEDLMEAVVTAGFSELLGHVDRAVHDAHSPREAISRCIEAHLDFFEANPDLMRIFHQVRGMLKFKLPEGRPLRRVLSHYLDRLGHSLTVTLSPNHTPEAKSALAIVVFGAVSGFASTHAAINGAPPNPAGSRRIVEALTEMVTQYASVEAAHRSAEGGGVDPTTLRTVRRTSVRPQGRKLGRGTRSGAGT
ncbi:MAG: TetR family transcriptional regulator [Candidatus Eisenbacteria bacterium]|nr:TetR family transcriptional regulator [Candidatus Eisenbacteria bacterium]